MEKTLKILCQTEKISDWSDLPVNVLDCIMDELKLVDDYVRFGAVCRPWRRSLQSRKRHPFRCVPPLLLIASLPSREAAEEVDPEKRGIYSVSREKVLDSRLQVPHSKACRGCSFGWLVTLERNPHARAWHDSRIQLQNPFSNRIIDLPPLDNIVQQHPDDSGLNNIVQQHPDDSEYYEGYYVRKAALSSPPEGGFVLLAIVSKFRGLALFKSGNTSWTSIGDDWPTESLNRLNLAFEFANENNPPTTEYMDIIFSRRSNRYYALNYTGEVLALNFLENVSGNPPKLTVVSFPLSGEYSYGCPILVEDSSSGDLFLVYARYFQYRDIQLFFRKFPRGRLESPEAYSTAFDLFKLDIDSKEWVMIDSIGDNIMFLGPNDSMMLPSFDCPGYKPNCIYFTKYDDLPYGCDYRCHGPPYDGVYSLDNCTVQPHYVSAISTKRLPRAFWIQPTLQLQTSN